jgi:S1-C subfamily serine protease
MMNGDILGALSKGLADAVERAAPAVVQVQGRRRPASGVVYGTDVVVTTARALGREDGVRVRRHDGATVDAEVAGWDPATGLVVLQAKNLGVAPLAVAGEQARVGQFALAVARSWSNNLTASAGIVSVIGGPLATGRRRSIEQVIRTSAPMHEGFAGGALIDTSGALLGVATAAAIRGLGVVIPARIAWASAAAVLEHGKLERGYLGMAGQPVRLPDAQKPSDDRELALLVVGVTPEGPAAKAGLLVGDVLLDFDGQAVDSPEDLLDLLVGERVGRAVPLRILRGTGIVTLNVTVGQRPSA